MIKIPEATANTKALVPPNGDRAAWSLFGGGRRPLAFENDDVSQSAVARFELLGSSSVHPAVAERERVTVELINRRYLRKLLLVGPAEIDPIETSWPCGLVETHLALNFETHALRRLDRRINTPALDGQEDSDLSARPARAVQRPCRRPKSVSAGIASLPARAEIQPSAVTNTTVKRLYFVFIGGNLDPRLDPTWSRSSRHEGLEIEGKILNGEFRS